MDDWRRRHPKETKRADIYMTAALMKAADEAAQAQCISRSDYLRIALISALKRDGIPVRPPRRPRRPQPQVQPEGASA
jgi:hypothetical protein